MDRDISDKKAAKLKQEIVEMDKKMYLAELKAQEAA